MASEVDICNLALARIGEGANVTAIKPPDGSAEAAYCARFLPLARNALLEMHPWSWAQRRASLADLSAAVTVPPTWRYAYAVPSNCVRILSIRDPNASYDEVGADYQTEIGDDVSSSRVVYANVVAPVMHYVDLVTDPTRFSPLFTMALTYELASMLAGVLIKGADGMSKAREMIVLRDITLEQAKTADANQSRATQLRTDTRHPATWVETRGTVGDDDWLGRR